MNGIDISKFPQEKLLELLRVHNRLALTLDGLWFSAAEEKYGLEAAIDLDAKTWQRYGASEARRLSKFLGVNEPSIQDIINMLMISPVFAFLSPKATVGGNKGILTVTDCLPQKQRIRLGKGEFPCKPVGLAYCGEFTKTLNPKIKWRCVVCPPDPHPPDVWCQWEFEI